MIGRNYNVKFFKDKVANKKTVTDKDIENIYREFA